MDFHGTVHALVGRCNSSVVSGLDYLCCARTCRVVGRKLCGLWYVEQQFRTTKWFFFGSVSTYFLASYQYTEKGAGPWCISEWVGGMPGQLCRCFQDEVVVVGVGGVRASLRLDWGWSMSWTTVGGAPAALTSKLNLL